MPNIKLHEIQSNLRIGLDAVSKNQVMPFGFYWTRKSPAIAQSLIETFCPGNAVVLDPFLGSGTTALGSLSTGKNRLFVGVELNELPIANLLFTISPHKQKIEEISAIKEVISSCSKIFTFRLKDKIFQSTKFIFDSRNGKLTPTLFEGVLDGTKVVKISEEHELFDSALKAYFGVVDNIPRREAETLATNSRIAVGPGMTTSDPFSPLNFEALFQMRNLAKTNKTAQLLLASCLHLCRLTDSKSQSQFPYWKPKNSIHEKSASAVLKKYLSIMEAMRPPFANGTSTVFKNFEEWESHNSNGVLLINGPSQRVLKGRLPDESVDLVLTDPPYFDQVAYSEYLKLYEYFTHFSSELDDEIVQSSRTGAGKTREMFLQDLGLAFSETRRVMKKGSLALIYFKDSKPKNLHDFISTLEKIGLSFQTQVHLHKNTYTYKQNVSKESTVGGDSIMVFQATNAEDFISTEALSRTDSERIFLELFHDYLFENGPSTLTESLDNGLILRLYRAGALVNLVDSSFFFNSASKRFDYNETTRTWSIRL